MPVPDARATERPFSDAELTEIRAALPAVQRVAYLNAGTLGPLPLDAIAAVDAQQRYDAEVRQSAEHWEDVGRIQADARGAVASLTGVAVEQAALMHSTHEGLNTVLWGLPDLAAGNSIVTTDEEHPGLLVPLGHLVRRLGVEVRTFHWHPEDEAYVAALLARVDARTRAVVVSHVSWVSGHVAPLAALRRALPSHVRLIVDGAQGAGILPVDPADGWDAYTVSGQKWSCGPNGTGGLALTDPEAWLPTFGAYLQSTSPADGLTAPPVRDGRRFETSQEAFAPLAGFAASTRWLVTRVGVERAAAHARALNQRFTTALGSAPVTVTGSAHLACVELATPAAVEVVAALAAADISIRALSPTRVRVSFGCWNTPAEVDACAAAISASLA